MTEKIKLHINNDDLVEEITKSRDADKLTTNAVNFFKKITDYNVDRLPYSDSGARKKCAELVMLNLIKYWRILDSKNLSDVFTYFMQIAKRSCAKWFEPVHKNRQSRLCCP